MSAKRLSLLAAATLSGVLAPSAPCWAQAYGAAAVVEHNDLRWFEPVELDLDGQMPRRDAGFFATADKLLWSVGNPKTEIGHEGLVVDSERLFPRASVDAGITALEQIEGFDYVNSINETLSVAGVSFALLDTNGTNFRRDDTEAALGLGAASTVAAGALNANFVTNDNRLNFAFRDTSRFNRTVATGLVDDGATPEDESIRNVTQIESVADLAAALEAIRVGFTVRDSTGAASTSAIDPGNTVVGGEPQSYGVRNSIRDALPDAGFAWGERYEFGYSDGEMGWMITVLDGPEASSGGVYGAGEAGPYTSQSGTDVYGPDPYFLSDLIDDDGDGIGDGDGELGAVDLFALGFGSVAVNFNLPNADFLKGFRDYNNGDNPFTVVGPILYVGNVGTTLTELVVTQIGLASAGANLNDVNAAFGASSGAGFDAASLALLNTSTGELIAGTPSLATQGAALQSAITGLTTAQASGDPVAISAAEATLNTEFTNLTTAADALGVVAGNNNQQVQPNNEQRLADDLNGNGSNGVINVIANVNGAATVVGQVVDYGDLFEFNVFFDQVTVRNRTEIDGVELMRMNELSTRHKLQQGRWDSLRLTYGARFLNITDDFYFQGLGSILGRTTVSTNIENQIVGPQIGLQWTRRDGPWDFIVEARGTAGYNIVDVDQEGIFGEEAIPGALNRSATARTNTSVDGNRFDEFSPLGELRVQLRYRVAQSLSLQAGYTAKYVGNIHRGGVSTKWNAPDWGVHDRTSDLFTNGLNFGIELRH